MNKHVQSVKTAPAPHNLANSAALAKTRMDLPLLAPLARLALPTVAVMFLVTGLSVAETYFVSTLGTEAVAAASLVVPVALVVTMVSNGGIGGGVSSAVARARGARDQAAAESLLWHALVLGVLFGLATTVLALLLGPPVYRALGGSGAALSGAVAYSNVLFAGSAASWSLMLLQAALRGAGNVKVPALVVAGSVAVGLLLSPVLITGAWGWSGMGVVGAGVAQVVTSFGALAVLILYLRRSDATLKLAPHALSRARLADILRIGIPSSLNAILSALALTAATAAAGAYGAAALAGYGIASRLDSLLVPVLFGFGTAAITLVGTALGAGDMQRARSAAITNAVVVAGALEVLGLLVAFQPEAWLSLFTTDPAVLDVGSDYLRIVAPTFGLSAIAMELYFAGQGARKIFWPMVATVARLSLALAAVALVQAHIVDLRAAFAIVATGITISAAVTLFGFLFSPWAEQTRR